MPRPPCGWALLGRARDCGTGFFSSHRNAPSTLGHLGSRTSVKAGCTKGVDAGKDAADVTPTLKPTSCARSMRLRAFSSAVSFERYSKEEKGPPRRTG